MKKQTAVEWLEQEMLKPDLSMKEILQQAKEMEKEQIKEAYKHDYTPFGFDRIGIMEDDFEKFYNETYGGNK